MAPTSELHDDFAELSSEILQLRNQLRMLEPEDLLKLGDGLRRLRQTLDTLDARLTAASGHPAGAMPSRLWRVTWAQALASAEAGYREAQAALAAEESVAAREKVTQAIFAYDKVLALFPPNPGA